MKIKKPRNWFKKNAEIEDDSEIGARETTPRFRTLNQVMESRKLARLWELKYLEALVELNKANKGLRRLAAKLKRNKPSKDQLKEAFQAGAARAVGSHKDFSQTHPNFEEWHKKTYGPKSK